MTIEEIKSNDVVYFSASWCVPCKMTKPIVEKVKNDRDEKIEIVVIDEVEPELLTQIKTEFSIRSVPTTIFFKDSVESNRRVGGYTEAELIKLIEE